MKIGELARRSGLSASRIRFYERIGLLKTVTRQSNGYRRYPPEALTVLSMITAGQQAGFSLDELRTLLPSNISQWDHASLVATLKNKISELAELERKIVANKAQLETVLNDIAAKPYDMDCAENAQRVMSRVGLVLSSSNPEQDSGK
ncbi:MULTISPECIES: MerR family transcriptional regulator [unclassified Salinivibrio]|uniref:MerR family transcriptional regulator n=1 Tax=unclassified Salinivibrio TaxID=2636825 RepID=UPI0006144BD8|nr:MULTISPECIES: MerR family transcriptional regulator [unclassified Salinivibrio]KKA46189.1 MerR family transcriptional regulator [Salinivibrio sp. KP-1]OOE80891.1 MerR family transcriptional regulator [Salinivibrio sp. ML198]